MSYGKLQRSAAGWILRRASLRHCAYSYRSVVQQQRRTEIKTFIFLFTVK